MKKLFDPGNRGTNDHTPWMITFADLLSLMITFFVLLFSMKAIPAETWDAVTKSLSNEFKSNQVIVARRDLDSANQAGEFKSRGFAPGYIENLLLAQMAGLSELQQAQIYRFDDSVVVALPGTLFFDGPGSDLKQDANKVIEPLVRILVSIKNDIVIQGHSSPDAETIGNSHSGWSVSLLRAQIIANLLAETGYSAPLSVIGLGASRLGDLDKSISLSDRYQLSNRIEIVIKDEKRSKDPFNVF